MELEVFSREEKALNLMEKMGYKFGKGFFIKLIYRIGKGRPGHNILHYSSKNWIQLGYFDKKLRRFKHPTSFRSCRKKVNQITRLVNFKFLTF